MDRREKIEEFIAKNGVKKLETRTYTQTGYALANSFSANGLARSGSKATWKREKKWEKKQKKKLRKNRKRKVKARAKRPAGEWRLDQVTPQQLWKLEQLGIQELPQNKGHASDLIGGRTGE